MFNSGDMNISKYLGWLERIIEIILKLFNGMGSSSATTTIAETTTVAETTTAAETTTVA